MNLARLSVSGINVGWYSRINTIKLYKTSKLIIVHANNTSYRIILVWIILLSGTYKLLLEELPLKNIFSSKYVHI